MNSNQSTLSLKESNALYLLKALLAVGIVMSHASFQHYAINEVDILESSLFDNFRLFIQIFECFACIGVPLFFFISGYLFFYNSGEYLDCNFFVHKIKTRAKSLLLPFFIANFIAIVLICVANTIRPNIIPIGDISISSISFRSLINWLWFHPVLGPTWFLRDLFIICLFSPLIYLISKQKWSRISSSIMLLLIWGGVIF